MGNLAFSFENVTPVLHALPAVSGLSLVSLPAQLVDVIKLEDLGKPVLLSELTPNKDLRLPSTLPTEKVEQVVQVAPIGQPALQTAPVSTPQKSLSPPLRPDNERIGNWYVWTSSDRVKKKNSSLDHLSSRKGELNKKKKNKRG